MTLDSIKEPIKLGNSRAESLQNPNQADSILIIIRTQQTTTLQSQQELSSRHGILESVEKIAIERRS